MPLFAPVLALQFLYCWKKLNQLSFVSPFYVPLKTPVVFSFQESLPTDRLLAAPGSNSQLVKLREQELFISLEPVVWMKMP